MTEKWIVVDVGLAYSYGEPELDLAGAIGPFPTEADAVAYRKKQNLYGSPVIKLEVPRD